MSGMSFEVEIKDEAVKSLLANILAKLGDLRPAMELIGQIVDGSVHQNFLDHRSPEGDDWPEVSPAYAKQKAARGRNPAHILFLNHILSLSVHPRVEGNTVIEGSSMPYARIHQLGGDIEVKAGAKSVFYRIDKSTGRPGHKWVKEAKSDFAQTVKAHIIHMPQRKYLGVRAEDWGKMTEALSEYILKG